MKNWVSDIGSIFLWVFLWLIALIGNLTIGAIGFLYAIVVRSRKARYVAKYFKQLAISEDQRANVICGDLFNDILKKPNGSRFGWPDETISSALGKNYRDGTLRGFGIWWQRLLDRLDKNHVTKSIEEDEVSK